MCMCVCLVADALNTSQERMDATWNGLKAGVREGILNFDHYQLLRHLLRTVAYVWQFHDVSGSVEKLYIK
jgi:hypothetical protein